MNIKPMNIRQKNPDIALPSTVVQKEHFLDNAFGPANYVPDVAAGSSTQWVSGLGKKFIDGRNEMGVAGIFEIGMGISSTEVSFFASIIDEYRPGITLGRSQVKKSTPETGGKSQTASLIAEFKKTWFKDRNFELQKQELSGSTFYIMDQKTLDPPTNFSGQINLVISKSEYDAISIPSNLDTTIHAPLLSFQNFSMESDNNQVPYRKAALKVNGATSSGTKTTTGLGVDLLTFNYGMLNSEAAGNVVELEEAENGILLIDTFLDDLKEVEKVYPNDNFSQTCLRIRVHSYGSARDLPKDGFWNVLLGSIDDTAAGHILNNALPPLNGAGGYVEIISFDPNIISVRKLRRVDFEKKGIADTWNRLTSHANENGIMDNPSPYIVFEGKDIDLGQILYGFESVYWQRHYPPINIFPPSGSTYSQSYANFPVKIVNDLTGWLANIITPVTDFFVHATTGNSPLNPPISLDFADYYEYSAPLADLYGNADGIGIYRAYEVLIENTANVDLRLSDIFILYYKGVSFLRPEISLLESPSQSFYTVADRWKIFSIFFGFMTIDQQGNYVWLPNNPTLWADVKSEFSAFNNIGKGYTKRLLAFAEFWYTTRKSKSRTGVNLFLDLEIFEYEIFRFSNSTEYLNDGVSQKTWVEEKILDVFENDFIPFIYSQL
ncbi:hypothetical protein G3O08_18060 [Cryomorpha ignava]|uniref:Uncharacterized protein n=1 Tax=Cryomorpha ignava TaxID=101383 RepID=A0A7K3WXP1_9FLAO|nr:hypothetical protein [Cryomorpha ignava]NEN25405.1 hypothetical protein [Cryomorpha ignava]